MAKANSNTSRIIKNYLKGTRHCKMLSKEEARVIANRIKLIEREILRESLKFTIFKKELLDICNQVTRNTKNAIKYSRKLVELSPEAEIEAITLVFRYIAELLATNSVASNKQIYTKLLNDAAITSSAILQMLEPIKVNHKSILEFRDKTTVIYKFLEVSSEAEYNALIKKCVDPVFRRALARELFTTDGTLIKKLRQQEEIFKFYQSNKLGAKEQTETLALVAKINKLQAKYHADREQLIQSNLPLVINRAMKFRRSGMDLEDLIQEGNIGLIKAVDKFDPDKEVKLSTYATWWIDQGIRRGIANKNRTVRIPIHVQEYIKKIAKAHTELTQEFKREPLLPELAAHTEIPLNKLIALQKSALYEVGIDALITEDGLTYTDVLFDIDQDTLFQSTAMVLQKDRVRIALADLTPRAEKIIRLRFGIGIESKCTLKEIGNKFQITKERSRQIESGALLQLKDLRRLDEEDSEDI